MERASQRGKAHTLSRFFITRPSAAANLFYESSVTVSGVYGNESAGNSTRPCGAGVNGEQERDIRNWSWNFNRDRIVAAGLVNLVVSNLWLLVTLLMLHDLTPTISCCKNFYRAGRTEATALPDSTRDNSAVFIVPSG